MWTTPGLLSVRGFCLSGDAHTLIRHGGGGGLGLVFDVVTVSVVVSVAVAVFVVVMPVVLVVVTPAVVVTVAVPVSVTRTTVVVTAVLVVLTVVVTPMVDVTPLTSLIDSVVDGPLTTVAGALIVASSALVPDGRAKPAVGWGWFVAKTITAAPASAITSAHLIWAAQSSGHSLLTVGPRARPG